MLLNLTLAALSITFPAIAPKSEKYKLVWQSDFNKSSTINPNDWTFEQGFVRNKELQWYQPNNAFIEKGKLIIEGRREHVPNPNYDATSSDWRKKRPAADYTSACVTTKGKHAWLYGRWEIKAKIKCEAGLWPAIWTVGLNKPWPHNGEIDILEFYQNTILANTAWGNGTWITIKTPFSDFLAKDPNWADKFHTWRMDWDPDFIRIYLDGRLLNQTDLSKTIDPDGSNPFHAPQSLLLNLAIGSTGGDPSTTTFPTRVEFESVKIFQKS